MRRRPAHTHACQHTTAAAAHLCYGWHFTAERHVHHNLSVALLARWPVGQVQHGRAPSCRHIHARRCQAADVIERHADVGCPDRPKHVVHAAVWEMLRVAGPAHGGVAEADINVNPKVAMRRRTMVVQAQVSASPASEHVVRRVACHQQLVIVQPACGACCRWAHGSGAQLAAAPAVCSCRAAHPVTVNRSTRLSWDPQCSAIPM